MRLQQILIVLFLCISCNSKETTRLQNNTRQLKFTPLEKYAVTSPNEEESQATRTSIIKCDSLFSKETYQYRHIGVVKYDTVPLWANPIKRGTAEGYLHFADTVSLLSFHVNNCSHDGAYYKVRFKDRSDLYVLKEDIVPSAYYTNTLAEVYFQFGEQVVKSDSVAGKKLIHFFKSRFSNVDTIVYHFESEDAGSRLVSGNAAVLILELWLYQTHGNADKKYSTALKMVKDKSLNEMRSYGVGTLLEIADKQLSNPGISKKDIQENYSVLKMLANEIMSAKLILVHWKTLQRITSEHELLNILLDSTNKMVLLLGVQMKSVRAISENKPSESRDILLKAWRKHPDVIQHHYDDYTHWSLIPTEVTLDSLLMKTQDYARTFAFIDQMQAGMTRSDSVLNDFLERKKKRLCWESDCRGANDGAKGNISKTEIVVHKNTSLKNGIHGKDVKRSTKEIKGKILSEYIPNSGNQHLVKIETDEGIFWVSNSDIQRVFNRPLFSPSQKSNLITDPVLKEALPMLSSRNYLITQVNDDNIPDLIGTDAAEFAIDGATSKILWTNPQNNGNITFIENDMYLPQFNLRLHKRSAGNEPLWTLKGNIPGNFAGFEYPVIRYGKRVFVFTSSGTMIEINDEDGTLLNTYKLPASRVGKSELHGKYLYYIGRPDDPNKRDTLYSINFDSYQVSALFALNARSSGDIQIADNKIYLQTGSLITCFDKNNGSVLRVFNSGTNVNFIVEKNYLIAWDYNTIKTFDLSNSNPIWSISISPWFNQNIIIKDHFVYACSYDQLYLISLDKGNVLKQMTLPFEVRSDGAMKYYDKKLLISGSTHLMIIENR